MRLCLDAWSESPTPLGNYVNVPLPSPKCLSIHHLMILIPHSLLYYLVMRYLCTAGLRKRIATLFFQYCKTPLFNAEAAKHIKVRYIQ